MAFVVDDADAHLRRLASADTLAPSEVRAAFDALERAFTRLQRAPSPREAFEALGRKAVALGAVPPMVRLLESGDPELQAGAFQWVGNLCGSASFAKALAQQPGAVERLVLALREGPPALATEAVAAVANLGAAGIGAQRAAAQAGAIPAAVQFLRRRGLPAKDRCIGLSVLGNYISASRSRATAVLQAGAMPVLARLARAAEEGVRSRAINVCWHLLEYVTQVELGTQQALQMLAAQLDFLKLAGPGTQAHSLHQAVDNVGALCRRHGDGEEMAQLVAGAGVEALLVRALLGSSVPAQDNTLATLFQVLSRPQLQERVLPALLAAGALEAFVKLMRLAETPDLKMKAAVNLCLVMGQDEELGRRAAEAGAVLPLSQLLAATAVDPEDDAPGLLAHGLGLALAPQGTRPELALLAVRAGALQTMRQMLQSGTEEVAEPALRALFNIFSRLAESGLVGPQAPAHAQVLQQAEAVAVEATRLLLRPGTSDRLAVLALGLLLPALLLPGTASAVAAAGAGRALQRWLQDPTAKCFQLAGMFGRALEAVLGEPDLVALEQPEEQPQEQRQQDKEPGSSAAAGAADDEAVEGQAAAAAAAAAAPAAAQAAAGSSQQEAHTCATCGAASKANGKPLMMCVACKAAWYCSGACQKEDWRRHKRVCRGGNPGKNVNWGRAV
jgi:hypothetical protein